MYFLHCATRVVEDKRLTLINLQNVSFKTLLLIMHTFTPVMQKPVGYIHATSCSFEQSQEFLSYHAHKKMAIAAFSLSWMYCVVTYIIFIHILERSDMSIF